MGEEEGKGRGVKARGRGEWEVEEGRGVGREGGRKGKGAAEGFVCRFSVCTRAEFLESSGSDSPILVSELSMSVFNLGRGIILLDMFRAASTRLASRALSALGLRC